MVQNTLSDSLHSRGGSLECSLGSLAWGTGAAVVPDISMTTSSLTLVSVDFGTISRKNFEFSEGVNRGDRVIAAHPPFFRRLLLSAADPDFAPNHTNAAKWLSLLRSRRVNCSLQQDETIKEVLSKVPSKPPFAAGMMNFVIRFKKPSEAEALVRELKVFASSSLESSRDDDKSSMSK